MLSIQIIAVMARHGGLPAGKAMMSLVGIDCGPVRPPLQNLTRSQFEVLRQELEQVGFPQRVGALEPWTGRRDADLSPSPTAHHDHQEFAATGGSVENPPPQRVRPRPGARAGRRGAGGFGTI
jgi:hypothetical protein